MPTFIYVVKGSGKRGYDISVAVYRVINNIPEFIGVSDHQTASWRGARGEAMEIIHKKEGYQFKRYNSGGYGFVRKDINIIGV